MADLRFIKNFPIDGITFVDITPKLEDKNDFSNIIKDMCSKVPSDIDYIIAPSSRGYLFGPAMAINLGVGFIPVLKKGKLPENIVITEDYEKEYGIDTLCLPNSNNYSGKKFFFVDDVLATGGTLKAIKKIISKVNGIYAGGAVYINLSGLNNEEINYVEEITF